MCCTVRWTPCVGCLQPLRQVRSVILEWIRAVLELVRDVGILEWISDVGPIRGRQAFQLPQREAGVGASGLVIFFSPLRGQCAFPFNTPFFRGGYGLRRGALAGASWWCYVVSSWAWSSFPFSGARCGTKLEVAWSVVCRSQGLAGVCGRSARFLLRLRHQVTPFFLWVGELLQGDLAHCGHPVGRFPEALRTWVPCISRCTSHKSDVTITSSSLPWSMRSSPDDAGRC